MASTSSSVLKLHQPPAIAPDDSDFLDSDAEHDVQDPADHEIEQAILSEPQPSVTKHGDSGAETSSPTKASAPKPSHDLIKVSRRLRFTYFSGWFPPASLLNLRHGRMALPASDKGDRYHWFNVDDDLIYLGFHDDWGPLNVAMFYRFCLHIHNLLAVQEHADEILVLYTNDDPHNKANVALLTALYSMIIDRVSPADAFHPFSQLEFEPFRDAGYGRPDFYLTIQDVLYGMHKAISMDLLDLTSFNLDEYERFEQVHNGDWNWLTPKFIAFASPNDRDYVAALRNNLGQPLKETYLPKSNSTFARTIQHFRDRGVKLVVRLNNPLYDKVAFEEAGMEHLDLYFDDGSNPSNEILNRFIEKADEVTSAGGVVAVHCKAGLGRTGVLIGAYLIWKHGFTASEAIGFMRMMRPGCVVGPQQHFMYENFVEWIRKGARESVLKEARQAMALEREAMWKAGRVTPPSGRNSLKRPATPENERGGADESSDGFGSDLPVTPRARKDPRLDPAAAVKPTPCVGQPRKSPSPGRKRVAPATVARLERNGSGGRRGLHAIGFHQPQFERVIARSGNPTSGTLHSAADENPGFDENDRASRGGTNLGSGSSTLSRGETGTGGNVLMEAQRLNVQLVSPPRSPKAALMSIDPVTATMGAGTPSPAARTKSHERTRSAAMMGQSSELTPTSPSSLSRDTLVRASPDIKNRYQLRDTSSRAGTPSSPDLREAGLAARPRDTEVLESAPLSAAGKEGSVLAESSAAAPASLQATPADAAGTATIAPTTSVEGATRLRTRSKTPSSVVSSGATETTSSAGRTVSKLASSGANGVSSSSSSSGSRPRQPSGSVRTRPTTSADVRLPGAAGTRTASGRLRAARAALSAPSADARLRTGSTRSAQDSRRLARAAEATGAPLPSSTTTTTTRTTTTVVRQVSGTRPSSRLLAPTAASTARAAATLKRPRMASSDLSKVEGATGRSATFLSAPCSSGSSSSSSLQADEVAALPARSVSGSSGRIGRSVRRRRSSTGDANIDVVA